jgi:hypothetical protein
LAYIIIKKRHGFLIMIDVEKFFGKFDTSVDVQLLMTSEVSGNPYL